MSTLLQYVDTAMVGQLGENATASVSVTTTVSWLIHCIPSAVGIAALSMIAQAYGRDDKDGIKRISGQLAMLVVVFGLIVGGISVILSPFIPRWMGAEANIHRQASVYFAIVSSAMIFRCSGWIFGSAIRATKDTKTPMLINMAANILNVILNYLLIYTAGLGVTGAAVATAISYAVAGVLMYAAFRRNKLLCDGVDDIAGACSRKGSSSGDGYGKVSSSGSGCILCKPDISILKKCAEIAFPVMCTNVASCAGYVVFASLVTGMGNTIFAAHSIAVNAETIFYIPGYGLRTATSTLIGIAIGEKNQEHFDRVSRLSIITTVLMMCVTGALLYLVAFPLMSFFTSSERVAVIGSEMLKLVAFSEPFFGLMIVTEGIFYGMGKTKYPFVVETLSMWGIRILSTYVVVRIWGMGLREVWYCMILDNICKALMLFVPFLSRRRRQIV